MRLLKTARILFFFAALLFVAKPFLGFNALFHISHPARTHSILVKIFSKRKPEDLEDANQKKAAISRQLTHPPLILSSTITCLLALLFTALFKRGKLITAGSLQSIQAALFPPQPSYLLTGKLII
ncbi:hypothetical protein BH09BAC6_BH09BAC6_17160 [soil metagenome]|jgi:hypothetical protein